MDISINILSFFFALAIQDYITMLMEGIMMTKDFIMMQMGDIGMKKGCIMMPKVDTLTHKASITHLKPEM